MVISRFGGGKDGARGGDPSHAPVSAPLPFAMIAEVRAYWEALRDGPTLPRRAQIDPRGIAGALEGAFILERIAPGIARFRLAGMALVDLMGMEVRGMPLSALFDPVGRRALAAGLEQVFSGPAVLDLRLASERGIGRPDLTGRMLILPLADDDGQTGLALGCLATAGEPGRTPRRFRITATTEQALAATPAPRAPRASTAPVAGLAEAAARYDPTAAIERPYLRLVKSDTRG
ncbi:MAG: PAS domain-containing protein [Pseudorhodobacter sp.]|nr:PAS domain-containing protein [Pseudorhodobacter sp.]